MSDICESCGCPEGVDGHDVLYRQIDDLKKVANVCKAIGTMDADERSMLCARITDLEKVVKEARDLAITCDDSDNAALAGLVYGLRTAIIDLDVKWPEKSELT